MCIVCPTFMFNLLSEACYLSKASAGSQMNPCILDFCYHPARSGAEVNIEKLRIGFSIYPLLPYLLLPSHGLRSISASRIFCLMSIGQSEVRSAELQILRICATTFNINLNKPGTHFCQMLYYHGSSTGFLKRRSGVEQFCSSLNTPLQ